MNILVNRFVPSGSKPALVAAVPLTSNSSLARRPSTTPDGEAVVSDTHVRDAVT